VPVQLRRTTLFFRGERWSITARVPKYGFFWGRSSLWPRYHRVNPVRWPMGTLDQVWEDSVHIRIFGESVSRVIAYRSYRSAQYRHHPLCADQSLCSRPAECFGKLIVTSCPYPLCFVRAKAHGMAISCIVLPVVHPAPNVMNCSPPAYDLRATAPARHESDKVDSVVRCLNLLLVFACQ